MTWSPGKWSAILFACGSLLLSPSGAWACTLVPPPKGDTAQARNERLAKFSRDQFRSAESVALVRVTRAQATSRPALAKPVHVFKGDLRAPVLLPMPTSCGGRKWRAGEFAVVYLQDGSRVFDAVPPDGVADPGFARDVKRAVSENQR